MEPGLVHILPLTVVAPLGSGLRATAAAVVGKNTNACFKLFNTLTSISIMIKDVMTVRAMWLTSGQIHEDKAREFESRFDF